MAVKKKYQPQVGYSLIFKGGVRRDGSGGKWYKSIGILLTKSRPDFQLDLSIPQGVKSFNVSKLTRQLVHELAIL